MPPEDPIQTGDDLPPEELEQTDPDQTTNPGPTDPPQQPKYSDRYVQTLEQQLRVQNDQIQRLIDTQTTPQAPPPPPPEDPDEQKQRFFTEPIVTTRNLIREELKAAIEPLTDFVNVFKANTAYDTLKKNYRHNPVNSHIAQHLNDPQIESAVDRIMEKADKNEGNLTGAIIHVLGLKAAGVLTVEQINDDPPPPPRRDDNPNPPREGDRTVPNPPHMRPSNPNPPRRPAADLRPLNELERRMASERWPGKTAAEQQKLYLNWLNLPAGGVIDADETGVVKRT